MTSTISAEQLGKALVDFSNNGSFPEEDVVSSALQGAQLGDALEALNRAKEEVETDIRNVSRNSAVDVDTWITNAKSLQDDIDRSRALANDIVRQAEASDSLSEEEQAAEAHVEFLLKEVIYSTQVFEALQKAAEAKRLLDEVELAESERRILDALNILDQAWTVIYEIPTFESSRAISVLTQRAHDLRSSLRRSFDKVWSTIIAIDVENKHVKIATDAEVGGMTLLDTLLVMEAFKESDDLIQKLHVAISKAIIEPRMQLQQDTVYKIQLHEDTLSVVDGGADRTIKSLLADLEVLIGYLVGRLPSRLAVPLSQLLMPGLISQITTAWLDSAIPSSLDAVPQFKDAIDLVQEFAHVLSDLKWHGADELHEWSTSAPKLWLTKRREASLDWTRGQLSHGIGETKQVERTETQTVSQLESQQMATGQLENGSEWDAAWSDDEKEASSKNNNQPAPAAADDDDFDAWNDDGDDSATQPEEQPEQPEKPPIDEGPDEDDAWGWGDEEPEPVTEPATEPETAAHDPAKPSSTLKSRTVANGGSDTPLREVTLTEIYKISSLPGKVLEAIISIMEDGFRLSKETLDQNPIAPAAAGLFSLPTLVLAMYRAVSTYYYTEIPGGSMYLYNDAMWLAEQLREHDNTWKSIEDLPRAASRFNVEIDANLLESFSKRGYTNEMNTQRIILNDLLGGSQNFVSGEDDEMINNVEAVIAHVRQQASIWNGILPKSAWLQALGLLISEVANKIITDVEDLSSLGADEAYKVAATISKVLKFDDLFMPDQNPNGSAVPLTAQYVPNWLKLHFLSEVLQSDLKDIRFLWLESDLSLYFTVQEVVDLIELSFEMNPRTRETIHTIRENPTPRASD